MTSVIVHEGVPQFEFGDGNSLGMGILGTVGDERQGNLTNLHAAFEHLHNSADEDVAASRERFNSMLHSKATLPATDFPAVFGKTVMQMVEADPTELLDFVEWADADHQRLQTGLNTATEALQEAAQESAAKLAEVGYFNQSAHRLFSKVVAAITEFGALDAIDEAGSGAVGLCTPQGDILLSNQFEDTVACKGIGLAMKDVATHEPLHLYGLRADRGYAFVQQHGSALLEEVTVSHMTAVALGLGEPGELLSPGFTEFNGYDVHTRFIDILQSKGGTNLRVEDILRGFTSGNPRTRQMVEARLDASVRQLLPWQQDGWRGLNKQYDHCNSLQAAEDLIEARLKRARQSVANQAKVREALAQEVI